MLIGFRKQNVDPVKTGSNNQPDCHHRKNTLLRLTIYKPTFISGASSKDLIYTIHDINVLTVDLR